MLEPSSDTGMEEGWDTRFDEICWDLTKEAERRPDEPEHVDLAAIPVGPALAMTLAGIDRSSLNGYQLVDLLQARERLTAHVQAGSLADMDEIAHASPGDELSPPDRVDLPSEFASDEIRAALVLTRRSAEIRMSDALDIRHRLPVVWELLESGTIDLARAKVFSDGTSHVSRELATHLVNLLADEAPHLTTGQLRARIRKLCVDVDPEDAGKRSAAAHQDRRLVIEPTVDGTANIHILDVDIADARAVGRRINGHMISLKREDRSGRSHDQLRADIATDLLLEDEHVRPGQGSVDIKVDMTTLAGLDDRSAEIPGMGPVVADVARKVVDRQHRTPWRVIVTDDDGRPVQIVTTRRRPDAALSAQVEALRPTCSFPGCRVPASDCDYDHITGWAAGGATSTENLGPKCRHDHRLKDHGWSHQESDSGDVWVSPLGRTYVTQGQSP